MARKLVELYSQREIINACNTIANRLEKDFYGREVHIIVLLDGAIMFASDLLRRIQFIHIRSVSFVSAKSYSGEKSTGLVQLATPIRLPNLVSKTVIVIDDIWDTGKTLQATYEWLRSEEIDAAEVHMVCLVNKRCPKEAYFKVYTGISVEADQFIVGYGMDLNGRYRELGSIHHFVEVTSK